MAGLLHEALTGSLDQLKADLAAAADSEPPYPEDRFEGRGIVICAGGARLFTCAWITIALLRRHLKCDLPIEVWHLGPQEMGPAMRGLLEELGAHTVDALEVARRHPVTVLGGWELKPYAVMHSRFREVLLLDADNVPIQHPGFLFETPEYVESGALFWPDIVRLSRDNEVWAVGGLDYRDMPSFESGQLVIDKSRCWSALGLTHWINQRSDEFYRFLHGDKDTFLLAWLKLGRPFHLVRHQPKLLDGAICQRGLDGRPLFQHRNHAKWILDGDNPRIAGFQLEDECRALLEELACEWDGRVFAPPDRSADARAVEAELATIREFDLVRVSSDERRIMLLPDHRVRSSVGAERYWHVADGPAGMELRIEGLGLRVCALLRGPDGRWSGRLLQPPGMPIELRPTGDDRTGSQGIAIPQPAGFGDVVGRVLDLAGSAAADDGLDRDIIAALRILARLDSAVISRLKDEQARALPASARQRVVTAALDAVAPAAADKPLPGHGWLGRPFELRKGYQRR